MVEYGLGPQPILRWYLDARISVKRFEVALATCDETSIQEVRDARSPSEARVEETRPGTLEPSSRRFSEWMPMLYPLIRPVNIYTSEPQVLSSDDGLPQKLSSLFCVSNAVFPHSRSIVSFWNPACPNLRAKALGSGR